jgi:hypothetical protein
MTIIPRNKQLRGLLVGGAAVSAVMLGPILVDTTAQAVPQQSCVSGGVCLTPVATSVSVVGTTTETVTVKGLGTTVTEPGTTITAPGTTITAPGTTITAPGTTITEPGTTVTQTRFVTATNTATATVTATAPGTTVTATAPGTTVTATAPGTTVTVTSTVSAGPNTTTNTNYTGYTGYTGGRGIIPAAVRGRPDTVTGSACGLAGSTESSDGEVETCGPTSGNEAWYATTPGEYNSIFNDDGSYYVSVGLFAPQYSRGQIVGCYYVPDASTVTAPGATTNDAGIIVDAVAFGSNRGDVSYPAPVVLSYCGGGGHHFR